MAAFKYILLVAALLGAASASRLELNGFSEVLQEAESGVEQYMESLIGKDRPDKDAEAVILTKYIVSPDRGLDFIKAFKLLKDAALELDGKPAIYALSKTKTDNILYYSYVAFETYKDLAEHLKQDATKKFIKFTAEEKIPVFTSPVITVE
ncbi:g2875 [Coccomyxa viridis]|uniref:G2875 protein n=1 Tax=Coccomyxa viridis TaxID=1274662 RepID=A0ABP1FLG1_9CHLO